MKKVLLATTILGMTAGFAAAEIAFTGEATAGFAKTGADSDAGESDFATYTSFQLSIAASGETDSGLAFGASTSIKAGTSYDFDGSDTVFESYDSDASGDNTGTMGNPTVFVSGDFGKVSFKRDGFGDFSEDDDGADDEGDVKYTHTIAGLEIGVVSDVDTNETSLSLGYEVSGIALAAVYDDDATFDGTESYNVSAEGTFGPVTAGIDYDVANDADAVTTLALEYAADAITVGVELSDDESWSASAEYSADGLTLEASTDNEEEWVVTAEYDLGGGLTAEAGTDSFENVYVGAVMSF